MTDEEMRKELSEAVNRARAQADKRRQRDEDNWQAVNKALYTLIVGHAAGLVACMTLLKEPKPLEGAGTFITVFGLGFCLAVASAVVWLVGRFYYWIFPLPVARALAWLQVVRIRNGNRWDIHRGKRDWWMGALALISTFLMVLAGVIAVCKFGTL
jgi:hypothetical protein